MSVSARGRPTHHVLTHACLFSQSPLLIKPDACAHLDKCKLKHHNGNSLDKKCLVEGLRIPAHTTVTHASTSPARRSSYQKNSRMVLDVISANDTNVEKPSAFLVLRIFKYWGM